MIGVSGAFTHSGSINKRGGEIVVAASDSLYKQYADYRCDGTDDQVQIQAAIDAAYAVGGGEVFLMAGNYVAAIIEMKDSVCLRGAGAASKITLKTGENTSLIVNSDTVGGNTEIAVKDFYVDGNYSGNPSVGSDVGTIHFDNVSSLVLNNIKMYDSGRVGIQLFNCTNFSVTANEVDTAYKDCVGVEKGCINGVVLGNRLLNAGEGNAGVEAQDGAHGVVISSNAIKDCAKGIEISNHTGETPCRTIAVQNNTLENCFIDITAIGTDSAAKNIVIANNASYNEAATVNGVGVQLSLVEDVVVEGNNIVLNNSGSGSGGLYISGNTTNCRLNANVLQHTGGGTDEGIGINVGTGAHVNLAIINNTVDNFDYKGIRFNVNSCSGCSVKDNHVTNVNRAGSGRCVSFESGASSACRLSGNRLQGTHYTRNDADSVYDTVPSGWSVEGNKYYHIRGFSVGTHSIEDEQGKLFVIDSSGGVVHLDLPIAVVGAIYHFYLSVAGNALQIDPNGTEEIYKDNASQGAGKYIIADAVGESVKLKCLYPGRWEMVDVIGTWTAEA